MRVRTMAGLVFAAAGLAMQPSSVAAQAGTRPAPRPAAGATLPAGAFRVQPVEIMDRQGFEKPLVAATVLMPAGWRPEGQVAWNPMNQCGEGHQFNWRATSPDGLGAMQFIPAERWGAGNFPMPDNPCPQAPVNTVRGYLEWYVQRERRGARVMDYRPRPDLAQPYQALASSSPMAGGGGMRSWVEGGEVLIAYQVAGKPVRETISTVAAFTHSQFPPIGAGPGIELLQGQSFTGFAMRAPDGALDFRRVDALRNSVRLGPEWSRRMAQSANERHRVVMESNRRMAEDNLRGARERSEIIARTGREISDMQMQGWQSRNESSDRTQRETIEGIRGVETYNDPVAGGTVQLSNQYPHAWRLNDGSYLLTDDVNLDPARDLGIQGQRLKPAQ